MPTPVIHTADFREGFRITSTGEGLRIQTVSYHADPIELNREQLAQFGLHFEQDHFIPLEKDKKPEGVVDKILASLLHAMELMLQQGSDKKWKWDIANLRRAFTILSGLDEEVVQKILDEERV